MAITRKENIPELLEEYSPIVFIVNILSHKWSLFILLSLSEPKRFNQLRRHLNISHSVLSKELKVLEKFFLINRRIIEDTNPPSVEYSLTEFGRSLLSLCMEMEELGVIIEKRLCEGTGEEDI